MPLPPKTRLGPYEILAALGAGGMGEVYRARDTRLERTVAIKILPQSFASDHEPLERFEQEARILSALNHPNLMSRGRRCHQDMRTIGPTVVAEQTGVARLTDGKKSKEHIRAHFRNENGFR
jgi:serine/threonine protein kinase